LVDKRFVTPSSSSDKGGQPMSGAETQAVRGRLLQNDDEYRQLDTEHQQMDHRLHELTEKSYLSTFEQLEEVTLKKRKLALKDRMEGIMRGFAQAQSHAS
jgi:uncharacterized protein YdcH (DUF465 family)